jgi:hypothetical protein
LLPNEAFKNSNQIALASKTLKIGFDNLKVGVLKSFSGKSWKKGSFFEYFYSFSPKILERKPTTIIGILTRPDGELISYNNILVGLDFHNPLDYICNEDLVNRKNLFIKRNIVLPQNLIPGKYLFKFIAVHGKSFISDERVKEICIPEGITPLNWNGFLEVFKLKYGLCARELIGGKKIIKLKEFIMENKIDSNFFSFEFCVE